MLDCLAEAYRFDLEPRAYVQNLVEAAADVMDGGLGVFGFTYDASDPEKPVIDHSSVSKRFDPAWFPPYYKAVQESGADRGRHDHPSGFFAWSHMMCGQASAIPEMRELLPLFRHIGGSKDTFGVNALDASGKGLWLGAPLKTTKKVGPERLALFTRFSAHLITAFRMRRLALETQPVPAARLSPAGALLDAGKRDEAADSRDELRRATLAFELARSKLRKDDELATRIWKPMVVSRWSLIDEFDTDGKRFVVAIENSPPTASVPRDLSEREHQVMTQAHLGHTNKVIAYELGLSHSTVRVLMHRAQKKLGATNRREAVARFHDLATARGTHH